MPDTAAIQPVYLDDVVETVLFLLQPGAPSRIALDLAGPRQIAFSEAVALFRAWLRWVCPEGQDPKSFVITDTAP
ncbi:hypothetical protein [Bradyrhizobium sp. 151]|uniref:hypothetical protein n=1 Tax=Bradyrhizobium sp. 151 TaxID=2782626 RepID=UPI001FFAB4F1|nr:hypothetical protein [Bradyrhizobium sp. 151]MCK1661477.1 hypothetical protein [Bradyrhizobium sp. 151]